MQFLTQEMDGKIQLIMSNSIILEGFNILGNLVVVQFTLAEYLLIQNLILIQI
ncbi:unnamed protein product [Paramecium primaurelia]|uniref:Uncharacterized protein n=1 Tax=Paramecium primaurelia TaxID=5886 RepID=A0A8S1KJU5_PARPR|nr:unnamed protein product [Paramecium primaurelia]